MKRSVLLLLLAGLAGCAGSYAGPRYPWRVEISTEGGLAGRGVGSYSIGSDGKATARLMDDRACTWAVTAEPVRGVEELLAAARPWKWDESYVPAERCCDRVHYTLTYDDVKGVMRDLKSIGAHNATFGRNRGLAGRGFLNNLTQQYEQFRTQGKLPATFEVIYGHAWRPISMRSAGHEFAPITFKKRI